MSRLNTLKIIWAVSVALLFSACANIVAPTGGPRDTTAPKLLNKSGTDSLLNFTGGKLELEFDEFIKIQDVQNNFQISPLTKNNPRIKIKKKSLIIELPDSLLEDNTTYNLSFGDAIKDLKESNAYQDLRLTFSTGSYFDSLYISGKILDAQSGLPDSIQVMLYPATMHDSMLLREKPLYVTKASNGIFTFRGLPAKQFKIAALSDKNSNYIYDAIGEKIAFSEKIIDATNPDSALLLYSFIEEKMIDTSTNNRVTRGGGSISKLSYVFQPDIKSIKKFDSQDTLKIIIKDSNAIVSTDKIRFYENDILDLSMPINYIDSLDEITLLPTWTKGANYMIVMQSAFLKDSTKGSETDTIKFASMAAEDYGTITIILDTALYQTGSILMLHSDLKEVRKQTASLKPMRFDFLIPKVYQLRLLYDENENGKWDAGDLKEKRQAELTIELPQSIRLKPNWEEKVEWQMGKNKNRLGNK